MTFFLLRRYSETHGIVSAFELYAASTDPASTDKNDRPEDSASTLAGKNDSDKPDEARTFWQKFTTFVSKITNKLRFKQGGKSRPATTPNDKCKRFKETFSRSVKVHFVGAWYRLLSFS